MQKVLKNALNHGGCATAMRNVLMVATSLLHYVVKLADYDNGIIFQQYITYAVDSQVILHQKKYAVEGVARHLKCMTYGFPSILLTGSQGTGSAKKENSSALMGSRLAFL